MLFKSVIIGGTGLKLKLLVHKGPQYTVLLKLTHIQFVSLWMLKLDKL